MELDQLLSAIFELSQSVARIPCPAKDKEEVLDKVKNLFTCYNSLFGKFGGASSANSQDDSIPTTLPKEVLSGATGKDKTAAFSEMDEKIDAMYHKLNSLEKMLNSTKESTSRQTEEKISYLKHEFATKFTAISQLQHSHDIVCNRVNQIENRSNELDVLQNRVEEINTMLKNKPRDQAQGGIKDDEVLKIYRDIANVEALVKKGECQAAFSASAASNKWKYKPGHIIRFRNVYLNINDCYMVSQSKFRCKLVGTYVFTTSINTNTTGAFTAAIMHNDVEVALFGTPGSKDLQTGTSAVLKLALGDEVYVKVNDQSDDGTGVEVGGGFSNFIGFKIA